MIAFTLLMGGMALLIVSFGTEYSGVDSALLSQQFEFFETAFLMMIAFYFGDKSLKYLQNRWNPRGSGEKQVQAKAEQDTTNSEPGKWSFPQPQSNLDMDENTFVMDDLAFEEKILHPEMQTRWKNSGFHFRLLLTGHPRIFKLERNTFKSRITPTVKS